MEDQGKLIGTIQKSITEEIRIQERTYKGNAYIDIRTYFVGDTGEWIPTKKGVSITKEKFKDFFEILKQIT